MRTYITLSRISWLLLGGLALVAVWARVYQISNPATPIFDEVYFPVFAEKYLRGTDVFDVHPPLGKFLLALPMAILGNTALAWRLVPLLAGLALPIFVAWLVYRWYGQRWPAYVLGCLVGVDTIWIAYSRVGLMDGVLATCIVATLLVTVLAKRRRDLLWVGLLLWSAVAIKWVALSIVPTILFLLWRKKLLTDFLPAFLIGFLWYSGVVMAGEYRDGQRDVVTASIQWHQQAYSYHQRLTATHPWGSSWETWPLMLRPVLFRYDVHPNSTVSVMTAMGNPVVWWTSGCGVILSLLALLRTLWKGRNPLNHPVFPWFLGYVAAYLPWAAISRVAFLYHYLPAYIFALLMLAYWLKRLAHWKLVVGGFLVASVLSGVYFLPFAMGYPLTQAQVQQRVWVNSWLYD
jgi:dolichyl-phosphate-mannose-protein mannosyltransferase